MWRIFLNSITNENMLQQKFVSWEKASDFLQKEVEDELEFTIDSDRMVIAQHLNTNRQTFYILDMRNAENID